MTLVSKKIHYIARNVQYEDILFDTVNSIVEYTRIGRTKAVTKLYRNGKLAAVRTITAEGTTYAFK